MTSSPVRLGLMPSLAADEHGCTQITSCPCSSVSICGSQIFLPHQRLVGQHRRMRALICRQWGKVDELSLGDMPVPKPAADEVLIRVAATAVNYADSIMVAGHYQTKPERPFSPGLEAAGTVEACGADVKGLAPGDRVMAILA